MKLLVHVMPWFGDGHIHRIDSYVSNVEQTVANQINVMKSARIFGLPISGVIMTWQGPLATFQHSAVQEWNSQCMQRGLLFALLMDPAIATLGSPGNVGVNINNVIAALNDPTSQAMLNSSCYLPEKFVLDDNIGVDMSVLQSTFPTLSFLMQGQGFGWPSINMGITNSDSRNAATVANLQGQHSNPLMKIPGIGMAFDDAGYPSPPGVTLASWSGARDLTTSVWGPSTGQSRQLDSQGGKLFFDEFATVPGSSPYLAYVTWNDYDEGTQIEDFWAMTAGLRIGN